MSEEALSKLLCPKPFMNELVGNLCIVKLKWGMEYKGILTSVDNYMNLELSKCEEWINGKKTGLLGKVLIRCNNVQYIRSLAHISTEDNTDNLMKPPEKIEAEEDEKVEIKVEEEKKIEKVEETEKVIVQELKEDVPEDIPVKIEKTK